MSNPRKTAIDAQVGLAIESAYGVFTAPTRFIEWTEFGVKRAQERIESKARRPGRRVLAASRWDQGRTGAEGPMGFEVPDRGSDILFQLAMGGSVTHAQPDSTNAPSVWEHTIVIDDLDGLSFTAQVGLPGVDGTTAALSYLGGKCMSWELANAVDDYLTLKLTADFREEDQTQALAVATYDATVRPLPWTGATITLDGAAYDVRSVSLTSPNGLVNDRFFLGDDRKREQVEGAELRTPTGELSGADFTGDLAAYKRFTDGTPGALVAKWEGANIEDTFNFAVEVHAPHIRFDGETPNPGDGVIEQTLPFTVLDNEVDEPLTIIVRDNIPGA